MSPTEELENADLRGPLFTRIGPYMCLIAIFGLAVVLATGPAAALIVGPLWAAPGIWWGLRIARLGAVATHDGLVVRNPIRTYTISWRDIRDVRLEKRRASRWQRYALFFLEFDRQVGVLHLVGRDEPIEIYATESSWFALYGRIFSQSPKTAMTKVEKLRSAWLAHAHSA